MNIFTLSQAVANLPHGFRTCTCSRPQTFSSGHDNTCPTHQQAVRIVEIYAELMMHPPINLARLIDNHEGAQHDNRSAN